MVMEMVVWINLFFIEFLFLLDNLVKGKKLLIWRVWRVNVFCIIKIFVILRYRNVMRILVEIIILMKEILWDKLISSLSGEIKCFVFCKILNYISLDMKVCIVKINFVFVWIVYKISK